MCVGGKRRFPPNRRAVLSSGGEKVDARQTKERENIRGKEGGYRKKRVEIENNKEPRQS